MGFNKGKRNKQSGNQGRKNGLRDSRRRTRGKEKSMARQDMIDGKISGERFDEDIVSSSDPRRKGHQRYDDDYSELVKPKLTRTVQLGVPRGKGKFASTNAAGRTTVLEDKFRKSSKESWDTYRAVNRRSMTVESGGLAGARAKKRVERETYLMSLNDILSEMLHFEVLPPVFAGTRGKGQRHRLFNSIKRGLSATQCVIVPDGGERPTVVFAYRVVMLHGSDMDLNAKWVDIFRPEHDYAVQRDRPPLVAWHPGDVFPAEHQGMFPNLDDGLIWPELLTKALEFTMRYGVSDVSDVMDQLKRHGPMIIRVCANVYAVSLVPPKQRRKYLLARVVGQIATSPLGRETVIQVFSELTACAAVGALMSALQNSGGTEDVDESEPFVAEHQLFEDWDAERVGDLLRRVQNLNVSPGTVVNALVMLVAAGWTLSHVKKESMPVATIFSCAKKVAGIAKCDTVDDAVIHLTTSIPIIISAVSAAIAARSLAPLFSRKSSMFEDFVQVRAAYDLHKTGQYPNSVFATRDSFVRALASVHRRFGDEAKARVMSAEVKQHLLVVNTMYNEVMNDQSGRFREAPYAVAIVGTSGIGKSVLTRLVADRVIRADGGGPLSHTDIYTQQPTDKYASGYDMSKRVVILDDLCNQRPTQGCSLPSIPTAIIIDTINNVMTPTNQADLAGKGKIFWNPRVVIATSNVLNLGAVMHSNEPVSILRRFNWFIEPTVRPEHRVHGGTGINPAGHYPHAINDLWTFDVYRWIPAEGGARMRKVPCNQLGRNCDIFSLLEFLERDAVAYYAMQRDLATRVDAQDHVDFDIEELRRMALGIPEPEELQAELQMFSSPAEEGAAQHAPPIPDVVSDDLLDWTLFPQDEVPKAEQLVDDEGSGHVPPAEGTNALGSSVFLGIPAYESPVVNDTGVDMRAYKTHSDYVQARALEALAKIDAERVRRVRWAQRIADVWHYFEPAWTRIMSVTRRVTEDIDPLVIGHVLLILFACAFPVCFIPVIAHLYTWYRVSADLNSATRHAVYSVARQSRKVVSVAAIGSGVAFVAWLVLRREKTSRAEQQGIVEFTMGQQIDIIGGGPPAPEAPTTTTVQNLSTSVSRGAVYVTMNAGRSIAIAILTPLKTGLYVGNYHTFKPILAEAKLAGQFSVIFTRLRGSPQTHTVPYENLWTPGYEMADIMFLKLNGPAETDVTGFLMPYQWLYAMGSGQRMPIRDSTMSLLRAPLECKRDGLSAAGKLSLVKAQTFGLPRLITCLFPGAPGPLRMIGTSCAVLTEKGDCGSPFFVRTNQGSGGGSYLAGVMAGRVALGSEYSLAIAPITDRLVAMAMAALQDVQHQSAAPLFGLPSGARLSPNRVHPDLPAEVSGVVALGVLTNAQGVNTSSKNTFQSKLKKSPFCDLPAVTEHLGPVAHKTPPQPKSTQHFARTIGRLERVDVPETDAERKAVEDLRGQLMCVAERYCADISPMTLFEAINGRGDVTAYPMDTSPGFGFTGKKLSYFEETCTVGGCGDGSCGKYHPTENEYVVPGRTVNYYPKAELLAQIEDLRVRLLAGETDLAVFRAALKDEAVDMSKEKMRVFFVGMMSWNLLIRQLYSPLFSLMKMDRLGSECAVGMDVLSSDWEELMNHLDAFNDKERLAGDFSNYDISIDGRLIGHSYSVTESLARVASWDSTSLSLMRAIGTNMMNPVYIVLGMVYRADGSNPSGVAITTWINSLVNSLIHRIAFYNKNPHVVVVIGPDGLFPFQRSVRLGTYGDDVLGAVRSVAGVRPITNFDVRDAAERLGMVFGPVNKGTAFFPEYYSVDDVSFLKCTDTYVGELGRRVGMVAQASVRKCLTFEKTSEFEARRNTAESALRLFYVRALAEEREQDFINLRDQFLSTLVPNVEDSIAREGLLPSIATITDSLMSADKVVPPQVDEHWWDVDL
jgi:hypothetical protein